MLARFFFATVHPAIAPKTLLDRALENELRALAQFFKPTAQHIELPPPAAWIRARSVRITVMLELVDSYTKCNKITPRRGELGYS